MNRSRLDLPHIKLFIANKIVNGCPQREIAKELNASQPAVCRMTKKEDVRELINQLSSELLQKVKEAFEKINNDPHFMAVIQEGIEKNMLNYLKRL
jgi:predicted transcriptional regulator